MRQLLAEAVGFAILAIVVLVFGWQRPNIIPTPTYPQPRVEPERKLRRPLLPWRREEDLGKATVNGPVAPDGTQAQCDLPEDLHMKNIGGRDGAGLCVFTSINHSALWQEVKPLQDFQRWMKQYPGGGYPAKVKDMIARKCKEAGVPEPDYVQVEGGDLEILKLACKTGRMPGITYGFSPSGRYGGQRIAHMVSLVHADDKGNWGILDNNYPRTIEWMNEAEFKRAYTMGGGGWAVLLLAPSPSPVPKN